MMSTTPTRAAVASFAAFLVVLSVCAAARAGEVVSTMRNVNAVPEAHGFRLNPAFDMVGERGPDEKGEPQAFEILRPLDQGVTLGRIYTSCTCIQLVAHKRSFAPGERAVLHLRNVRETPVNGQIYAIYVQISAPVRTTLRFDTFVQSNSLINPGPTAETEAEAEVGERAQTAEGEAPGDEEDEDGAVAVAAATGAEGLTAEELPEMPGIEIIVPGSAGAAPTGAAAVAEAEEEAEVAATEAAAAAEAQVAAANAALEAARAELAAIMSTRSEELSASPATDAVRDEIDSFFAAEAGRAPAPTAAPAATPAVTAAPAPAPAASAAATSGWQVVAAAPAAAPASPAARPTPAAPAAPASVRAVSLITLGVRDIARSSAFYEAIGWQRAARSKYDAAAFFQLHGQVLALYPQADMLREQGMADARPAPGGITLALHVATPEEVATEFDRFVAAGGRALKEPVAGPGGAVSGYVADPDGNPWEISCVPQFVLDGEGGLWLR